jgi:general secretion pathway protein G
MTHPIARKTGRRGFTLVELMIAMVIIGLLVSLLTVAVVKALNVGKRTKNRAEISQLEAALSQFKQRFGVIPPSRLKLCEHLNNYNLNNQLDADSVAFITKMFPSIDMNAWSTTGMNWNGNKDPASTPPGADIIDGPVILEGDQCLVFCLGGIPAWSTINGNPSPTPVPPAVLGFSANPKLPAYTGNPLSPDPKLSSDGDRIGPFFEFQSSRLVLIGDASGNLLPAPNFNNPPATNPLGRSHLHYSYLDTYGVSNGLGGLVNPRPPYQVYAYFSSYKATNGYNRYFGSPAPLSGFSDCPSLYFDPVLGEGGVPIKTNSDFKQGKWPQLWPYAESDPPNPRYQKPNLYQIISAGGDGEWGPGSQPVGNGFLLKWTPSTAAVVYANPNSTNPNWAFGSDDQSNFASAPLGTGE